MLALGQAIRSFRIKKGISQKELAGLSKITASFLSQVEAGSREASLTVLRRLAAAMRVAPEVLLWEALELPEEMNEGDRRACELAKVIVRRVYENAVRTEDDR